MQKNPNDITPCVTIKVMGYPATVEQIFYYVIEMGLGIVV